MVGVAFICCNINAEAYKYKRSAAPSRTKWRLNDIIAIN